MNNGYFSIIRSVTEAYRFLGVQWRYLLRLALLPMGVMVLTDAMILLYAEKPTVFTVGIASIPAMALTGWFLFHETRLFLLGERMENLPPDPAYLQDRRRAMNASVLMYLLLYLAVVGSVGIQAYLMSLQTGVQQGMPTATDLVWSSVGMIVFAVSIWAVRYGFAHIFAAVDFPVRKYARKSAGLGISFRVIGMAFMVALPAIFFFSVVLSLFVDSFQPSLGMVPVNVAIYFTIITLMNAAGASAVRQMLSDKDTRA